MSALHKEFVTYRRARIFGRLPDAGRFRVPIR